MIQLNLPLSATALREGAEFLTKLSQLADVIREEARGPATVGTLSYTVDLDTPPALAAPQVSAHIPAGAVVDINVGSAGGDHSEPLATGTADDTDAITAAANACLPPQFETVVIGHERNPDYAGELAAYDHAACTAAGWTDAGLLENGYLREVTEQRPLAVAPSASAPPAPAAPAPAAPGIELDADGLPWDARIHSDATVRKAATGKWKTRKNLPAGYKEQIEAELRGVPTAAPAPPAPNAPAPAPAGAPGPSGTTFAQFVQWAMGHQKAGRCNQTDVQLAVQGVGLKDVPALSQNPGKIAEVMAALKLSKGLE